METLIQIAKRLGIQPNPNMTKDQFEKIQKKIRRAFGGDSTWSTMVDSLYNKRKKVPQIWNEKIAQKNIEYLKKMSPEDIRIHDQDNFPVKLDEDAIFVWHSARQKGEHYQERFAVSINLDDPKLPTLYKNLDGFIKKYHAAYKITDFGHIQRTDPLNIYMTKTITPEIAKELYGIVGPFLKKQNHAYLDGFSMTQNGRIIEGIKYGPEPLLWREFRGENRHKLATYIRQKLKELPEQFNQRDLFGNIRDSESLGQVSANVQYMDLIYYLAGKEGQNPFQLGNQYGLPIGQVSERYARKYDKKIDISEARRDASKASVQPTMRELLKEMQAMRAEIQSARSELMQLKKENAQWRLRNQALRAQGNASKSPKGRMR